MPCTTPPCSWPSTISGLITMPKSLTRAYLTTSTTPVSGSTSTSADMAAVGKVAGTRSIADVMTSSDCGASGGSLTRRRAACRASSMMPIARSVPAITKRPSANSMSAAAASSTCAAICLAFLDHLRRRPRRSRCRCASATSIRRCRRRLQAIAVALNERDLLERHAEPLAQHLGERRRVAHAEIERAGGESHRAVGVESDVGQFLRRAAPSLRESCRCRARAVCRAARSRACGAKSPSRRRDRAPVWSAR